MQVYLPIAELSVNILLLIAMGGGVGFLSGMFGVGGGFLMTPLLIFAGVPPAVAVATEANRTVASASAGVGAHWRRKAVDFKMGGVLLAGGLVGSSIGVALFRLLRQLGQIDLLISIAYVLFLGSIGGLMMFEAIMTMRRTAGGGTGLKRRPGQHNWIHGLPFKMRFKRSRLYISAIPPLGIGFLVGLLASMMGVGGGFIMVPAMIYLLRMPTNVVIGTSLFQIMFVTAFVTVLHAVANQTVDMVLAFFLLIGSVVGVQFGAQVGARLRSEQLRALLALLVLLVCARLAWGLVATPANIFSLGVMTP
jgi:uncharacterized membrane protein YfcA